jgi:Polyketide cyclase / dehydrase and lipid transport
MLTIIIVVAVFLGALLLYAATKPDSCQFSRSIHISATPERIFPLIDNLRVMNEWNPFVKADPDINLSYSGPVNGVGAANDFDGNGKVGSGRAEIVESIHPSKIVMALHMVRPMKCQNRVEFRITPRSDGADVTWAMSGRQPFIGKLMSVFINTEKMVGGAFESGLAELKTKVEA